MPGVTRNTVIRGVTAKELYDVVVDYGTYPRFFTDFTGVSILKKDGATWTVEFRVKVIKEVSYTLSIVHDEENLKTSWTFLRGKMVTDSTGGWTFTELDGGGGARIDYQANMEVNAPGLPGFIKRKIQDAILNRSIKVMFDQLEREAKRRR